METFFAMPATLIFSLICAWQMVQANNTDDGHLRRHRAHYDMMTSSNGNIFRVSGHLCGEFTGPRWIPRTKASDAELWCFFDLRLNKRLSKQWWGWWFETLSHPLWRHRNDINVIPHRYHNFDSGLTAVEVWAWVTNYTSQKTLSAIIYPCHNFYLTVLVKEPLNFPHSFVLIAAHVYIRHNYLTVNWLYEVSKSSSI